MSQVQETSLFGTQHSKALKRVKRKAPKFDQTVTVRRTEATFAQLDKSERMRRAMGAGRGFEVTYQTPDRGARTFLPGTIKGCARPSKVGAR